MKLVKRIFRKCFSICFRFGSLFESPIQKRKYLGYTIYYNRGTSLVESDKDKEFLYEPQTCNLIIEAMKKVEKPNLIDIGVNIGLISLSAIKNIPNLTVFAFEPGEKQYKLLKKTITKNKLNKRIKLSKIAISNKNEIMNFCIHNPEFDSADGFIDTNRAGKTKQIKVQTQTLDQWWLSEDKPQIDGIKIDTEGAELWVLEGAIELIKKCRPFIITEINQINYLNYPHDETDVLDILNQYNYIVYNENGVVTDFRNLKQFQEQKIETYYCIPT